MWLSLVDATTRYNDEGEPQGGYMEGCVVPLPYVKIAAPVILLGIRKLLTPFNLPSRKLGLGMAGVVALIGGIFQSGK